jgi:hypothetical protein
MKCPHCGMNIRDNVVVCGYCGGTIVHAKEKSAGAVSRQNGSRGGTAEKSTKPAKPVVPEQEDGEEEDDGLSRILLPGEQVLIGSLNISVKKFTFHAYLTNQRIFLIDTEEKKLKVTAKDVPRDTVVGSIVEFSENSDPVLVLSVKSVDDDIKTMKLVFTQSGVDRSAEIDDWIALLQNEEKPKKSRKPAPVEAPPEPEEEAEEEEPEIPEESVRAQKPIQQHELQPSKKPAKDHEKQVPTKRLLTSYRMPEPEPEEKEPEKPHRRTQFRMVEEPVKRQTAPVTYTRESPTSEKAEPQPVKKPEVHSAMKYAMKSPLQPTVRQPTVLPVRKPVSETVVRHVPEPVRTPEPPVKRQTIPEPPAPEEGVDSPQFCHNCGKKIPGAANFCPGCGTKLGQHKSGSTVPRPPHATAPRDRTIPKAPKPLEIDEEEVVTPPKPPIKKAPKGSDMTILHKFLRR